MLEKTYLKYLEIYHATNDNNGSLFRSFIDNWYAYYRGGPFLNSSGNPKWFNNPNPQREWDALTSMDFVSKKALSVMEGKHTDRLVKDHSIPIKIIRSEFSKLETPNIEIIKHFLIANYKLGVITKTEDRLLDKRKLRSGMPENWDGKNWRARYEKVNIEEEIIL